jgi:hypothetical protein
MKKYNYILFFIIVLITIVVLFIDANIVQEQELTVDEIKEIEQINTPKKQLKQVPKIIKTLYFTGPYMSSELRVDNIIKIIKQTEINSVIVDIKDFSGRVYFDTNIEKLETYDIEMDWIDIDNLIKKLHDNNIYVIGRIVVFEDQKIPFYESDLALKDTSGNLWQNYSGLYWLDPTNKDVWKYNIDIAKEAWERGFDEINFDYIRFPTDGNLQSIKYKNSITRKENMLEFYKYTREELKEATISIDLFGLTTVAEDDLGIGQDIETASIYFNYVCPMLYPSHFTTGFKGLANPVENPYKVVNLSLNDAKQRIDASKIRPWLQDFDLHYAYNEKELLEEIKATEDALGDDFNGYMLWNPQNIYTVNALLLNK